MSCKLTYKGKRYNSKYELYKDNIRKPKEYIISTLDNDFSLKQNFEIYNAIGNPFELKKYKKTNPISSFHKWLKGLLHNDVEQDYRKSLLSSFIKNKGNKIITDDLNNHYSIVNEFVNNKQDNISKEEKSIRQELNKIDKELSEEFKKKTEEEFVNSIFPDSKVKKIIYHGSKEKNINKLLNSKRGKNYGVASVDTNLGFFAGNKIIAAEYAKDRNNLKTVGTIYPVIFNTINPIIREYDYHLKLDTEKLIEEIENILKNEHKHDLNLEHTKNILYFYGNSKNFNDLRKYLKTKKDYLKNNNWKKGRFFSLNMEKEIKLAKENGNDGIIWNYDVDDFADGKIYSSQYVVFDEKQTYILTEQELNSIRDNEKIEQLKQRQKELKDKLENIKSQSQTSKNSLRQDQDSFEAIEKWSNNKTKSKNVKIVSKHDIIKIAKEQEKTRKKDKIIAYRVDGSNSNLLEAFKKYNAIGNPFIAWRNKDKNAAKMFFNWLIGKEHQDVMPEYRKAILNAIKGKSVETQDKTIIGQKIKNIPKVKKLEDIYNEINGEELNDIFINKTKNDNENYTDSKKIYEYAKRNKLIIDVPITTLVKFVNNKDIEFYKEIFGFMTDSTDTGYKRFFEKYGQYLKGIDRKEFENFISISANLKSGEGTTVDKLTVIPKKGSLGMYTSVLLSNLSENEMIEGVNQKAEAVLKTLNKLIKIENALNGIYSIWLSKENNIQTQEYVEIPNKIINVYWGQAETEKNTRILSNLALRSFTYKGVKYGSVEHAYQTLKSGEFDKNTYDKYVNRYKKNPKWGGKIRGKSVKKGFDNLSLMKELVIESFKQNPYSEAADKLLQYSDFTHNTNTVIDKAFLEGLKLAQKELLKIRNTSLNGKEILYYKKLNKPSHATALDYLINKYDWDKDVTQAQELIEQQIIDSYLTKEQKQIWNKLKKLYPQLKVEVVYDNQKAFAKATLNDRTIFDQRTIKSNQVNYTLKAVEILQSDKAKRVFEKGKKEGWDLERILNELEKPEKKQNNITEEEQSIRQELNKVGKELGGEYKKKENKDKLKIEQLKQRQKELKDNLKNIKTQPQATPQNTIIPKAQKELILEKGLKDREEILASLLAENTFTVEVSLSETILRNNNDMEFYYKGNKYSIEYFQGVEEDFTQYFKNGNEEISEKEYYDARKNQDFIMLDTQYYKNLSARQKNSSNIKYNSKDWSYQELEIKTPDIIPNIKGHSTFSTDKGIGWFRVWINYKTGEVELQEMQSDLFQNGRDEKNLTGLIKAEKEKYNDTHDYEDQDKAQEIRDKLNSKLSDVTGNKFLQLLNKKGAWINFFIQSIVQDSAKKGFKIFRFPLGETAARIEGLDSAIDRIKNIDEDISNIEKAIKNPLEFKDKTQPQFVFKYKTSGKNLITSFISDEENIDTYDFIYKLKEAKKDLEKEKQDSKTQSLEKLAPIQHFYENVVSKKVKQLYKNVKEVIDEEGNKWLEVDISKEENKSKNIWLQKIPYDKDFDEEYWRDLYLNNPSRVLDEIKNFDIPTIKNKFKPDEYNVYHGTNKYEIDKDGYLILKPSNNFNKKINSVSLTQIPVVAQNYALRKGGNYIIKIDNDALGKDYNIENLQEISVNKTLKVKPGHFKIIEFDSFNKRSNNKIKEKIDIAKKDIKSIKSAEDAVYEIYHAMNGYSDFSNMLEFAEYDELKLWNRSPKWYKKDVYSIYARDKYIKDNIKKILSKFKVEEVNKALGKILLEDLNSNVLGLIEHYGYDINNKSDLENLLYKNILFGKYNFLTINIVGEEVPFWKRISDDETSYFPDIGDLENLKQAIIKLKEKVEEKNRKYEEYKKEEVRKYFDLPKDAVPTKKLIDYYDKLMDEKNQFPFQRKGNRIAGQANIKAMSILLDAKYIDDTTIPHEFAHFYIEWNKNTEIVKEALKKWASKLLSYDSDGNIIEDENYVEAVENLVQAIAEQVVKQKGNAYNWWKRFLKWLNFELSKLKSLDKEKLKDILTQAFLNNENLQELNSKLLDVRNIKEHDISISDISRKIKSINYLSKNLLERFGIKSKIINERQAARILKNGRVKAKYSKVSFNSILSRIENDFDREAVDRILNDYNEIFDIFDELNYEIEIDNDLHIKNENIFVIDRLGKKVYLNDKKAELIESKLRDDIDWLYHSLNVKNKKELRDKLFIEESYSYDVELPYDLIYNVSVDFYVNNLKLFEDIDDEQINIGNYDDASFYGLVKLYKLNRPDIDKIFISLSKKANTKNEINILKNLLLYYNQDRFVSYMLNKARILFNKEELLKEFIDLYYNNKSHTDLIRSALYLDYLVINNPKLNYKEIAKIVLDQSSKDDEEVIYRSSATVTEKAKRVYAEMLKISKNINSLYSKIENDEYDIDPLFIYFGKKIKSDNSLSVRFKNAIISFLLLNGHLYKEQGIILHIDLVEDEIFYENIKEILDFLEKENIFLNYKSLVNIKMLIQYDQMDQRLIDFINNNPSSVEISFISKLEYDNFINDKNKPFNDEVIKYVKERITTYYLTDKNDINYISTIEEFENLIPKRKIIPLEMPKVHMLEIPDGYYINHRVGMYTQYSPHEILNYWIYIWSKKIISFESAATSTMSKISNNKRISVIYNKNASIQFYSKHDSNTSRSTLLNDFNENISSVKYPLYIKDTHYDIQGIKNSVHEKIKEIEEGEKNNTYVHHDEYIIAHTPQSIKEFTFTALSDDYVKSSLYNKLLLIGKMFGINVRVLLHKDYHGKHYPDDPLLLHKFNAKIYYSKENEVIKGFFDSESQQAYLIDKKPEILIHEAFGHPFLELAKKENKKLYKSLSKEALNNTSAVKFVKENYLNLNENSEEFGDEVILKVLEMHIKNELDIIKDKGLIAAIKNFLKYISSHLKKILNIDIEVKDIENGLTIKDLAQYIIYGEGKMNLNINSKNDNLNTDKEDDFLIVDLDSGEDYIAFKNDQRYETLLNNLNKSDFDFYNNISNKSYTLDDLKNIINEVNNKYLNLLFNSFYSVLKNFDIKIKFYKSESEISKFNSNKFDLANYNISTKTIRIYLHRIGAIVATNNSKYSSLNEHISYVMMHELIHVFTEYNIKNKKLFNSFITEEQSKAIKYLNSILTYLRNHDDIKNEYGLLSISELLAELSNKEFVDKLKNIEVPDNLKFELENKNLYEIIVLKLLTFLGLYENNNSVLTELYKVLSTFTVYNKIGSETYEILNDFNIQNEMEIAEKLGFNESEISNFELSKLNCKS